ncbi:MAG: hypothetical protein AABX89_08370 [Candidatus Thermoplasmatota archaeon]
MDERGYLGTSKPVFDWNSVNWLGLFFLVLGVAWLGDNMAWWAFNWSMLGPIALIFTSIMLLLPRKR